MNGDSIDRTSNERGRDHTNVECPKCHGWRWGYIGETCRTEGCDGIMCAKATPSSNPRTITNNRIRVLVAHIRDELDRDTHPLYKEAYLTAEKDMVAAFEELLIWRANCTGKHGSQSRCVSGDSQSPDETSGEPEAWLFHCWKPGSHMTFATVHKDDSNWWPSDQWKGVTRVALVAQGAPELIHGEMPPSERLQLKATACTCSHEPWARDVSCPVHSQPQNGG